MALQQQTWVARTEATLPGVTDVAEAYAAVFA